MTIDDIIDYLNTDYLDKTMNTKLKTAFGSSSMIPLFNFIKIKNRLKDINIMNVYWLLRKTGDEEHFNPICHFMLKNLGPEYFLKYINDVRLVNGEYYIYMNSLSDFQHLFNDRFQSEVVKGVFGQDWFNYFDINYRYLNYHREIVENLNETNYEILKKTIMSIGDDYEYDEYLISDDIDIIMGDADIFNDIINNVDIFNELKNDLTSLYSLAYNEAWVEQMYPIIWDTFSDFFDQDSVRYSDDGNNVFVKIKDFNTNLDLYFRSMVDYEEHNMYYDDEYIKMLFTLSMLGVIDEFEFKTLDYPNDNKYVEQLNEHFGSYIYGTI